MAEWIELYHDRPGWMVERDENRKKIARYIVLGATILITGLAGVQTGKLITPRGENALERHVSYDLLPTLVQPYDLNKNGRLERDESYRLFRDYDLQKRPAEKLSTTHFN